MARVVILDYGSGNLRSAERALRRVGADVEVTSDWHRLSKAWRPRLDEQIERIERLRDRLDGCIGCGCLSLKSCALTNPGDDLADRGPGAVLLDPDRASRRQ